MPFAPRLLPKRIIPSCVTLGLAAGVLAALMISLRAHEATGGDVQIVSTLDQGGTVQTSADIRMAGFVGQPGGSATNGQIIMQQGGVGMVVFPESLSVESVAVTINESGTTPVESTRTQLSGLLTYDDATVGDLTPSEIAWVSLLPLVNIDTVLVAQAGNVTNASGFGSVPYDYRIGKYEVTLGQYATFLNAVATTNTNFYIVGLWNYSMAANSNIAGISRSGSGTAANPYVYSVIGSSNRPVAFVSWFAAARFANWMHNGAVEGAGTETGAYALNGATWGVIPKNADARWWIPSDSEWVKAAFYDPSLNAGVGGYYVYPTRSDAPPGNIIGADANQANFYNGVYSVTQSTDFSYAVNYLSEAGVFTGSASAYGTYDQGGNLSEWTDGILGGTWRTLRGGAWSDSAAKLQASSRVGLDPNNAQNYTGFRLAALPTAPFSAPGSTNTNAILVISAEGEAQAGAVYQNTSVEYTGSYGGVFGTNSLMVINTLPDNYRAWAGDTFNDAWEIAQGMSGAVNPDATNNGVPNWQLYAMGYNPAVPAPAALSALMTTNGYLAVTYTRNPSAAGYAFDPQESGNLSADFTNMIAPVSVTNVTNGVELITTRGSVPMNATNKQFLRVKVIRPTP